MAAGRRDAGDRCGDHGGNGLEARECASADVFGDGRFGGNEIERAFADAGHIVVSNSRNHRMEPDVPLLVPEMNPAHLELVPEQQGIAAGRA